VETTAIGENSIAVKKDLRYQIFAREYVTDLNGTRAAIAAGYSAKSATSKGSQLLTLVKVQRLIDALKTERAEKLEITADSVLAELAKMGFANILDYVQVEDGNAVVNLSKLTWDQASALREITVDRYAGGSGDGERRAITRTRFKLHDKIRALELMGRHLKLFTERIEGDDYSGLAEILSERRKALSA